MQKTHFTATCFVGLLLAKEYRICYRKQMKKPFPYERPLSWSQISSFQYNPRQWYDRYVNGEEQPTSKEMEFGKMVGEKLATDPAFLPTVPRLPIFEHELKFDFNGVPMIGYIDALCLETNKLYEYKTGRKKWDQKRANEHGQIEMYLLGLYQTKKLHPKDIECHIHWLPTHIKEGAVAFIEPFEVKTFKADRTMADILRFGQKIIDTQKEMEEYYRKQTYIYDTDFFAK